MKRINIVSIKMVREGTLPYETKAITSPAIAYRILQKYLEGADREYFVVMCLSKKNEILAINTAHVGLLDSTVISPREVFKPAILANARYVIVAHNHPSGDPTEGLGDIQVTNRLVEAGKILGIEVLDHIILGENRYTSLKEKGFIAEAED